MINLYFWISFLLHVLKDMGLRSYWLTLWVKTRQRKDPLDTLPSRLWETWSTSKSYGSGMLECACTRENVAAVQEENVAAVQELTLNHIQTHHQIRRQTGLSQSPVVHIIDYNLGLKRCRVQELSEANRCACSHHSSFVAAEQPLLQSSCL